MQQFRSPLSIDVPDVRDPKLARDRGVPFGALAHTTGRGVCEQAKHENRSPLAVALETYIDSQNGSNGYLWGGPHYVIDYTGGTYCIAPENAYTAHAGSGNRPSYLSGHWKAKCSGAALAAWFKAWPTYKHPYALFPSRSPNADYVGIEMIPIGYGFGGSPMAPGLLFTKEQHCALAALVSDMAKRHSWPDGWHRSSRLAGHEDVDLLERMDSHGGWDPGYLRAAPYFDFDYVRNLIA